MAGTFHNITADEMNKFMAERKFRRMTIPGTVELVFGKIVNIGEHRLSLRVYTGINPSGESRAKGTDAIRVQLYFMHDGEPAPVGKSQMVKRITTWEKNLDAAIARHSDAEHFRICEACGNPLVERETRDGKRKFWGCVTYFKTKCPGYVKKGENGNGENGSGQTAQPAKPARKRSGVRIPDDMITDYQLAVDRLFRDTNQHIMIGALAGSGKTAMCLHLSSYRDATQLWQYIVFNRKNAAEGRRKFPRGIPVQTQHSFDARWIRKCLPDMPKDPTNNKLFRLMDRVYPHMSNDKRKRVRRAAFRLTNLSKAFACRPGDLDAIGEVFGKYDFELESQGEVDTCIEVASGVLEASLPQNCGHEWGYDDLLWWPVVLDLEVPKLGIVLADECQDFNYCQHDRLRRLAAAGARIIAVGDRNQAVYRFRGADNDSFDTLKAILADTPRGVVEAELPENFRCGREHLRYVREHSCVKNIVPHAGQTVDGKVIEDQSYDDLIEMLVAEFGGKVAA